MDASFPRRRMSDQQFCSTHDAAKLLGVSVKTVQLWTDSGELRSWKTPGGHRRIARSSVEEALQKRERSQLDTQANSPRRQFTILVVDDDPDVQRLYELMIPHWGLAAKVTTAKDGFEGLIRIGAEKPDLLITDLRMPGMDGLAMISSLRADPVFRDIRIFVCSGLSELDIAEIGTLPADIRVFPKPIPFEQLRPAIEECLREQAEAD
jgi:excisionase family DNA binding protein